MAEEARKRGTSKNKARLSSGKLTSPRVNAIHDPFPDKRHRLNQRREPSHRDVAKDVEITEVAETRDRRLGRLKATSLQMIGRIRAEQR